MSPLPLTYASCRYDRIEPLRAGEVTVEGIDLNVIVFPSGRQIFDRMVGGEEFDASELSASEFISLMGRGNSPFVAISVFPSRVFRHGYIFVNTRSGIRTPKHLEGRRVGLPLYTQTASIWLRGHLMHQFGVDIDKIHWVQGAVETGGSHGNPHALPLLRPVPIEINRSGRPLGELLACGAIDAYLGSRKPPSFGTHPDVVRLLPNHHALERELYERERIFPIMHLVAIRRALYERHPWIAQQPVRRVRRIQTHRARTIALCRLARRHAAVAAGRDRGNRRSVSRRRSVPLRRRTEPADLGGAGALHGRAALHSVSMPVEELVRAAAGSERDLTKPGSPVQFCAGIER